MDGHGHINTAHHERLPKKNKVTQYYIATKGLPERQSTLFIEESRRTRSDAIKRRSAFSFTVTNSAENNFLLLLKHFITTALEYKTILKL